jgi:hypothetical protein
VQGQPAIREEPPERRPLIAGVADGLGDRRLVENEIHLGIAPGEERLDDGFRLELPQGHPLLGWGVPPDALDAEQTVDQRQRLPCAVRVRPQSLEEVAPGMCPTPNLDHETGAVEMADQ